MLFLVIRQTLITTPRTVHLRVLCMRTWQHPADDQTGRCASANQLIAAGCSSECFYIPGPGPQIKPTDDGSLWWVIFFNIGRNNFWRNIRPWGDSNSDLGIGSPACYHWVMSRGHGSRLTLVNAANFQFGNKMFPSLLKNSIYIRRL